ncbi:hypothetical protein [Priestia megaterium]|uniref:Uncharacterized protein n=1 Tax=Priestia megaterium TaxID=1404 RepID=A0A6M6E8U8_PRIMG|nr:hypothetical protein [Priestia megaterium]QJX80015.1 hypothetical protein FDZ14_28335 [Priestia megaterium]
MNEISTKEINQLEELTKSFKNEYSQVVEERAIMLDDIRLLERRIEVLRLRMPEPPNWITDLVEPITKLVANKLKVKGFKVKELRDLDNSVKVSFFNKDEEELYKIILIPEDLEESLILYKTGEKVDKNYGDGTLGALNDMSDKTARLPLNNINEVVTIIRNL